MNCDILITPTKNGFAATILGLPGCVIEAPTRDEAIEKVKAEAEDLITKSEIVRVEINGKAEAEEEIKNRMIGIYSDLDDETWNQFQAAMKEARAEIDSEPNRL